MPTSSSFVRPPCFRRPTALRFSCAGPPGQCTALGTSATRAGVGCKRLLDDDGAIRRTPRLTARQRRQAYKIGSCSCPAAEIVNSRHDTFGGSGVAGRNSRNPPTQDHARVVACPSSRRASYATIVLTCPRASPSNGIATHRRQPARESVPRLRKPRRGLTSGAVACWAPTSHGATFSLFRRKRDPGVCRTRGECHWSERQDSSAIDEPC